MSHVLCNAVAIKAVMKSDAILCGHGLQHDQMLFVTYHFGPRTELTVSYAPSKNPSTKGCNESDESHALWLWPAA